MNIGLIVAHVLLFIYLLLAVHDYGKRKDSTNDFLSSLVSVILFLFLFWWVAGWSMY